ncbi:MAG: hypothetical protein RLY35_1020 [Bacteroidota bacterium]|jgi:hypothetical protein
MKGLLSFLLLLSIATVAQSQGILKGKVTDEKGEPVFGVVVVVIENQSLLSKTDFDGLYELIIPNDKKYTINYVMTGFKTTIDTVVLKNNQTMVSNITLFNSSYVVKGLDIVGKVSKSNDTYMEKVKMNSATTIDYISSETMKKTGDQNVVNAVARVSGVSTTGGLITVRGIGDRYIKTLLNGSRIPTLDPLTNNIKLDIFPSSLIDNIIITKTAQSNLASDWSGAYISVETKDYPDQLSISVESQFGYNPQVTFKDFITSARSKTDRWGFDNGMRRRTKDDITMPNLNPSTYDEMVALGLGDFYANLGIHGWTDGNATANNYQALGLVELGLLAPNQLNNPAAVAAARQQYNATLKPQAFAAINPDGTDYNNGFLNNWNTRMEKAPMNFSQNFSIGNETKLFGKKLGYFIGMRYGTNYRFDPNGMSQRVGDESLNYPIDRQDYARISRETNSWNVLLNANYKLSPNHKIGLLFMPNIIGTNDVAQYEGMPFPAEEQEIDLVNNIFYEQRKQLIYQLNTEHYFPEKEIKIQFNTSYTDASSIAPDFKINQYSYALNGQDIVGYNFAPTFGEGIRRFYRYLGEDLLDSRLDFSKPIQSIKKEGLNRKLFWGASALKNNRKIDNDEYKLFYGNNNSIAPLMNNDLDSYLSPDKFIMNNGVLDYYYQRVNYARNHSFGESNVYSAYSFMDYEKSSQLRFIGGLRAEQTDIFVDVDSYHDLGYDKNDTRRENVGGFPLVNPASIQRLDVLPNASMVYKLKNDSIGQTNLRFNYSKSLARPSIRELSDAAIVDNEFRTLIYGNSDLKMVTIQNFDFRAETYFKKGHNASISAFYKNFHNHIEMGFGSAGITWDNIEKSKVLGLEFEGNVQISPNLEFKSNLTLVQSEAQFIRKDLKVVDGKKEYTPMDTINRPMFGQAPYLINSILSYTSDSLGFGATISYNVQGPRLVIAGAIQGRPDVYEMPRHIIDFKINKKINANWSTSLTIRDILNTAVRRSYQIDRINNAGNIESTGGWYDYDKFRYGTNFQLSIQYKI